jgi:hypothetical protein
MSDGNIMLLLSFAAAILVVMAPVIRLNGKITELTVLISELKGVVKDKTDTLDKRVTEHGKEIDELKVKQARHEERINKLEQ